MQVRTGVSGECELQSFTCINTVQRFSLLKHEVHVFMRHADV